MDNFADHPQTLGEIRSDRASDAAQWSPRDVLISLLRDIDGGAVIDALVVCYRLNEGNGGPSDRSRARFKQSTPDGLVTLGLLTNAAHRMLERD